MAQSDDALVGRHSVAVMVDGPLGLCDLLAWGRAPDGWWALVGWHEGGVRHPSGYPSAVYCTGWVHATVVRKWFAQSSTADIRRVRLDGVTWPAIFAVPADHHFGMLDPDASPPLPRGYARIHLHPNS